MNIVKALNIFISIAFLLIFHVCSCDSFIDPEGKSGIGNSCLGSKEYKLPMDTHITSADVVYMARWSAWRLKTFSQWYAIDYIIEEVNYSVDEGHDWMSISMNNVDKHGIGQYIFLLDYDGIYCGCMVRIKVDYRVK